MSRISDFITKRLENQQIASEDLPFENDKLKDGIEVSEAKYSYQIRERRKIYRFFDCILMAFYIRNVPRECDMSECIASCPPYQIDPPEDHRLEPQKNEVWKSIFTEVSLLIRHDDLLNWQKFHCMLFVFGALLTGYVWSSKGSDVGFWICLSISLFGIILSWGADLTFQEGLRCLRGHRRRLAALERRSPPAGRTFILTGNPYNQRDVLEAGPLFMSLLFTLLLILAPFIGGLPTNVGDPGLKHSSIAQANDSEIKVLLTLKLTTEQ